MESELISKLGDIRQRIEIAFLQRNRYLLEVSLEEMQSIENQLKKFK